MVGRSNLGEVDTLQAGSLPRRSRNPREWPVRTPTFSADYPNDDFFPSARIRLPTGTGTNGSGHSRPESVLPVVSKVAIRVFVLAMAARFGRREGCRWPCRLSLLSFGEVSAYHTRFAWHRHLSPFRRQAGFTGDWWDARASRPSRPSRASGCRSLGTPWGVECCVHFLRTCCHHFPCAAGGSCVT